MAEAFYDFMRRNRGGQFGDMLAGMDRPATGPTNDDIPGSRSALPTYDTDKGRQDQFLAQRVMRGAADLGFGAADLVNTFANAGIRDVDYLSGGGLSGGSFDPFQLPMASQSAANLAAEKSGAEIIDAQTMPPDVQRRGELAQMGVGMLPVGPETLAPALKLGMAMVPASAARAKTNQFALPFERSAAAPGTQGMSSPLPLADKRISQRVPTSPTASENALTDNLLINMDVLKSDPAKMKQAADIIATYPGFGSKQMLEMHPEERLDAAQKQMTDNLLHIYDMTPPEGRARSSQWYLGANRIAGERAAETGFDPAAAAGTYAALSPQKDWFMNVNLGDKVLRTLAEDPRMTADHLRLSQTLYRPEQAALLRGLEGKRLSEMPPEEQALAIRLFDEIKGDRPYQKISPEGDYGQFMMTKQGVPANAAWQTGPNVEKAIGAAMSGGDPDVLSTLMGGRHKVRNFFNNIVAPRQGEQFGDITADTHQIAASLFRPLGGSSPEVATGLGSGSPSSNTTGMRGLYPIYADATRHAAAARGEPVRSMQSIPWEGIRSLFPDTFKTAKNQQKVDDVWRSFDRGEISADRARQYVIEAAGGFRPPTW